MSLTASPRGSTIAVRRVPLAHAGWMLLLVVAFTSRLAAQGEPESPVVTEPLHNGFQISVFSGLSYNTFNGGYFGPCPCDFVAEQTSVSWPAGIALNVPLFSDAALYLRAGWQPTSTEFFSGRIDSLKSTQALDEIGDVLTVDYTLFHVDVLFRLIGRLDGERIFVGPSFGFVRKKSFRIVETEYLTGTRYLIDQGDVEGARSIRTSLVLGVEYAFIPVKNVYIIPSLQIDYSPQKISDVQPIRPIFYKLLVNVGFQLF